MMRKKEREHTATTTQLGLETLEVSLVLDNLNEGLYIMQNIDDFYH